MIKSVLFCFENSKDFKDFFLSFQFLQKQYDGILDLAASVDITAKADWELRLYSCDERKLQ